VLERIREFLWSATYEQLTPKSALCGAMNYVRNNWDELQTFLRDGRCPIVSVHHHHSARSSSWV